MLTDPIADMLTRIRNANSITRKIVRMPASKMKVGIAQILKEEGFIQDYQVEAKEPASELKVELKYGPDGEHVIRKLDRVSKPGCRVYSGSQDVPRVMSGQGLHILSTPRGILSDRTARELNVGGEILCKVY